MIQNFKIYKLFIIGVIETYVNVGSHKKEEDRGEAVSSVKVPGDFS